MAVFKYLCLCVGAHDCIYVRKAKEKDNVGFYSSLSVRLGFQNSLPLAFVSPTGVGFLISKLQI